VEDAPATSLSDVKDSPSPPGKRYEMRSLWQRIPAAMGFFAFGAFTGFLIYGSQQRVVWRLYLLPAAKALTNSTAAASSKQASLPGRRLVIQSAANLKGQGRVVALETCQLDRSQEAAGVNLSILGIRGPYWMGMDRAKVEGKTMPEWEMKAAIYKAVYGQKGLSKLAKQDWESGPVLAS